jgi:RNA polymerase subunit RPABC4/transcription elongation factor Spt4
MDQHALFAVVGAEAAGLWLIIIVATLFSVAIVAPLIQFLTTFKSNTQLQARERILSRRRRTAHLEADLGIVPPTEGECASCHKPLQVGAAFCAYCGKPTVARPRVCPTCYTTTQPDASFCPQCGTALPSTTGTSFRTNLNALRVRVPRV